MSGRGRRGGQSARDTDRPTKAKSTPTDAKREARASAEGPSAPPPAPSVPPADPDGAGNGHRSPRPRPPAGTRLGLAAAGRRGPTTRLRRWLLKGHPQTAEGPHEPEGAAHRHPWWQVMCLTGVDYFSTLGYQPGIAALAAGALAPLATLILVLVTLVGALPMYKRVAAESPHGDGSISMLENLLPRWQGKLLVLSLLGFVATGFIITITLSAADAAAHVTENPYTDFLHGYEVAITLVLIGLLGAVFLKGFREAIGIAVVLVAVYLVLNVVVVLTGFAEIANERALVTDWRRALTGDYSNPLLMLGAALLVFPRLALGLSGFETGVVVMPLVEGDPADDPARPAGRIRSTHRLLTTAAAIMSVLLIASSLVTTILVPEDEFEEGGEAYGRALSFVAHEHLGDLFGTLYDVSTITILWFAGASALAGLLNIVPRYLPRYGMAPEWAAATRPLVLIFVAVCALVTLLFRASVTGQAGAYATGVLAIITSATVAVTLSASRRGERRATVGFGAVAAVFVYTTAVTIVGQPEGLGIAVLFILGIVVISVLSRTWRATELRVDRVVLDATAERFVRDAGAGTVRIIANDPDAQDVAEYREKERTERRNHNIADDVPVLFLEVEVTDPSAFAPTLKVRGAEVEGYRVLRAESSAVPNAIAALLLDVRDRTGSCPHAYFGWTEGNPIQFLGRFLLLGEGETAPLTREVLRKAEPDPEQRPAVHVA